MPPGATALREACGFLVDAKIAVRGIVYAGATYSSETIRNDRMLPAMDRISPSGEKIEIIVDRFDLGGISVLTGEDVISVPAVDSKMRGKTSREWNLEREQRHIEAALDKQKNEEQKEEARAPWKGILKSSMKTHDIGLFGYSDTEVASAAREIRFGKGADERPFVGELEYQDPVHSCFKIGDGYSDVVAEQQTEVLPDEKTAWIGFVQIRSLERVAWFGSAANERCTKTRRKNADLVTALEIKFFETDDYRNFRDRVFTVLTLREARMKLGRSELKGAALFGLPRIGKTRMVERIGAEYQELAEMTNDCNFGTAILSVTVPGRATIRETCYEALKEMGYKTVANRDEKHLIKMVADKLEQHKFAALHLDEVQDSGRYLTSKNMKHFVVRIRNFMQRKGWPVCIIVTGTLEGRTIINQDRTLL